MVLNSTVKQVIFWVVIIGGAILLYRVFHNPSVNQPVQLSYSELVEKVEARQVQSATIEREKVIGKLSSQ